MNRHNGTQPVTGPPHQHPERDAIQTPAAWLQDGTRPPKPDEAPDSAKPPYDGWRLETTSKILELRSLVALTEDARRREGLKDGAFWSRITEQLNAAQRVADKPDPRPWWKKLFWPMDAVALEATLGSIDAVETSLLRMASPDQLIGRLPTVRAKVNRYLPSNDPRRLRVHRISRASKQRGFELSEDKRDAVVAAYHAAASQRRRDLVRAGSFFGALVATTLALTAIALVIGILGMLAPRELPLCFHPESDGNYAVVCPTATTPATKEGAPEQGLPDEHAGDLDDGIRATAGRADVAIVELVGLLAAALAAAAALRGLRGTSTPYRIPLALAALKLPAGAVTAVAGLLLMQGGFMPGLSALDTSAQIIAWALIFGYSQQLLTGLIDRQAHGVLSEVGGRGTDGARPPATT